MPKADEAIYRQFFDPEELERSGSKKYTTMKLIKVAFYLSVRKGPAVVVKPGDTIEIHDNYLVDALFFSGRAEPLDPPIPDTGEYLTRRPFQATIDGEYKQIPQSSVLRLSRDEALDFMKRRLIRPLDEKCFYIP